jgi:hypothetical protein
MLEPGLVDGERIAVAEDDGPLDHLLQLANIARPTVALNRSSVVFAMRLICFPALFAERSTRYSTSRGMSSARSRNDGTAMGNTFSL